ncbi:MAG: class I SAM-dependent methyltransferase [Synergistaceae bacterium]|nr:class I SAM-dependent methyltransferase [Synergistaceae bacterium]
MRIKNVIEEISANNVHEFYNTRAANYNGENIFTLTCLNDKHPAITEERNKAEIMKLLPKLKLDKDSCVLDLACGFGRWLDSMPEFISKYRGIDFSSEMIKLAETRNTRSNAKFLTGSVLDVDKIIPGEMGSFNRILMMGLLVYMNDSDILALFDKNAKYYSQVVGGKFYE